MFWWISCRFQGSPTQKQSIVPTFMLATICAGGTTMVSMSLSGSMPPAASADPEVMRAAGEGHRGLHGLARGLLLLQRRLEGRRVDAELQVGIFTGDGDALAVEIE